MWKNAMYEWNRGPDAITTRGVLVRTVEGGGRVRMHPSRSMVLQPRRVGYMSGVLGEEGLASGHSHAREAA
jgi:hypothetical protein